MNPHFVEILKAFRDAGVEHIVIGAHALAAHGHVRATLDIELWVRPTAENAERVWRGGSRTSPTSRNSADAAAGAVAEAAGASVSSVVASAFVRMAGSHTGHT
ncbi:MAG: hypothetical protein ACKOZU_01395 [Planctomycetaceae bacterium]